MAETTSAGALRFGQCPVALRNTFAARDPASHELSDLLGGNEVLAALKDQGWNRYLCEIASIVGCEGDARKCLGDVRIGPTEAVGQFRAEFGAVRIAHDGRRHRSGPADAGRPG
jgi:hypothetical protein